MLIVWTSGKCDVSLIDSFVVLSSPVHWILPCPAANRNISFKKSAIPLQPVPTFFKLDLTHQKVSVTSCSSPPSHHIWETSVLPVPVQNPFIKSTNFLFLPRASDYICLLREWRNWAAHFISLCLDTAVLWIEGIELNPPQRLLNER